MSLLHAAYLNGSYLALFEALNICMDGAPYRFDEREGMKVDAIPVWLLQAFREIIVFKVENSKKSTAGRNKQDQNKYLCYLALSTADNERSKKDFKLDRFEHAKEVLANQFNLHLGRDTIKKYVQEFKREDRKLESLGKYLYLGAADQKIYDSIIKEWNKP